jgi:hypothetical protein
MKKVILFVLVLAVCAVLHNSALAQDLDPRYRVTYWRSRTGGDVRAVTMVTVVNQSDEQCRVQVEWLDSSGNHLSFSPGLAPSQSIQGALLNPGAAFHFCSRTLADSPIATCSAGGVANPVIPQGTNQGQAIVYSTPSFDCSRIAVDARVYFTTGSNAVGDTAISAISNSKVVFFGEGNLGD